MAQYVQGLPASGTYKTKGTIRVEGPGIAPAAAMAIAKIPGTVDGQIVNILRQSLVGDATALQAIGQLATPQVLWTFDPQDTIAGNAGGVVEFRVLIAII